jgi:DNA-binding LacI/PurR family transcriptional regulator
MPNGRPPTQADVARLAGVSTATVSYVLRGRRDRKSPVTAATRQNVLAAARELGYRGNHAARSLRRRRTEVVAVIDRPASSPWGERLVEQLQSIALLHGYSVITMPTRLEASTQAALRILHEQHVDGAILTPGHTFRASDLADLADQGLALVAYDDVAKPDGFDVVRQAERRACTRAVEHLIDRGHRRIAYFGHAGPDGAPEHGTKYVGYRRALEARGMPLDPSLVFAVADSRTAAFQTTTELLQLRRPPTAVFSASDRAGLAAIWAAQQCGRKVPDDLAVVGVGNTNEGEVVTPALTTVGSPTFDFTDVVNRLFERLTADQPLPGTALKQTWELLVRESS